MHPECLGGSAKIQLPLSLTQELKETQNRLVTSACESFASAELKEYLPPLPASPSLGSISSSITSSFTADHLRSHDSALEPHPLSVAAAAMLSYDEAGSRDTKFSDLLLLGEETSRAGLGAFQSFTLPGGAGGGAGSRLRHLVRTQSVGYLSELQRVKRLNLERDEEEGKLSSTLQLASLRAGGGDIGAELPARLRIRQLPHGEEEGDRADDILLLGRPPAVFDGRGGGEADSTDLLCNSNSPISSVEDGHDSSNDDEEEEEEDIANGTITLLDQEEGEVEERKQPLGQYRRTVSEGPVESDVEGADTDDFKASLSLSRSSGTAIDDFVKTRAIPGRAVKSSDDLLDVPDSSPTVTNSAATAAPLAAAAAGKTTDFTNNYKPPLPPLSLTPPPTRRSKRSFKTSLLRNLITPTKPGSPVLLSCSPHKPAKSSPASSPTATRRSAPAPSLHSVDGSPTTNFPVRSSTPADDAVSLDLLCDSARPRSGTAQSSTSQAEGVSEPVFAALKLLVLLSGNKECLSTLVSYMCLPKCVSR